MTTRPRYCFAHHTAHVEPCGQEPPELGVLDEDIRRYVEQRLADQRSAVADELSTLRMRVDVLSRLVAALESRL